MGYNTIYQKVLILIFSLLISLCLPGVVHAQTDKEELVEELSELSIEELLNLDVLTVEKRAEKILNTPSAVYVITEEDIRRSGVTTIAETLRGIPGIQVSRIDSNLWAVSSRGFNERYSNKLLVMIDGRTIYTPIFSGVYWDVQDTVLEDIDKIEVVRGPGSTIWGANAVNGVINVLTKNAKHTQGLLFSQVLGNEDKVITTLRYGGKYKEDIYWRIYGKYTDRDSFVDINNNENNDRWYVSRAGFRVDWLPGSGRSLTLQGDIYEGKVHSEEIVPTLNPPYYFDSKIIEDVSGSNILGRWHQTFSADSDLVVQFYYDRVKRVQHFNIPGYEEYYKIETTDLDITHTFKVSRHHITWGGGIRYITDRIDNSSHITFNPKSRSQYIFNAFVQDEIELLKDRLYLTLGTKVEHNEYTDLEFEPTIRLLWHPAEGKTLWAAVSRAVRTPSRIEMDGRINQAVYPGSPPVMISLISRDGFKSEDVISYEIGYRAGLRNNMYIDIATFYNEYDNLRSFEKGPVFVESDPVPHIVQSYLGFNKVYGETYGLELSFKWKPLQIWKLSFSYSYLQIQLHTEKDSTDTISESAEGESPHNQFTVISYLDITPNLEFDAIIHYIDNLPSYNLGSNLITNLRLGWNPSRNVEFSLYVENLFDNKHPEIASKYVSAATVQIQRSVYAKMLLRF
ncbi:MAG: TonB-dependent receptor [Nitrospirae bacterium]|nr:TonB-dependent receptor [Nitrospirota bacterium]